MNVHATVPPPPGRLVTLMLGNAGLACSRLCTTRAVRSDDPPAPDATTMSTFCAGFHSCACATPDVKAVTSTAAEKILLLDMPSSSLFCDCRKNPSIKMLFLPLRHPLSAIRHPPSAMTSYRPSIGTSLSEVD